MLRQQPRSCGAAINRTGVAMSALDDFLDEEFPLGDGTAETEAQVQCPYCGGINDVALDPAGGSVQDYVEDCQVCCRPWRVLVTYQPDGSACVQVEAEDLD